MNDNLDDATPAPAEESRIHGSYQALVMGAIGVVFGDLGTSPLYTMKEAFSGMHGMPVNEINVLGVISLVTWTLVMVVAVKYVSFIMRAGNRGEGGIMAMMALAQQATRRSPSLRRVVILAAVMGAALFYGDGVITPSITVLSSIEGLEVATPFFKPYVVPLALLILVVLFSLQKHGTGKVGKLFGPVMCVWFVTLAVIGIWNIIQHPSVLRALNPWYAVEFFTHHYWGGFITLGAVVLCVTGAEALYTDMGHYGRSPIRAAWYGLVMPGLLLNYFGQAANLLADPASAVNPFYHSVPQWALYPMIVLATAAAVIASQAVISGAFSITRQAIQLGFVPRMKIVHTSPDAIGQIYLPWINWMLLVAVILVVIEFGSSSALAGAYGIAVTGTMAIDTVLFLIVARLMWKWSVWYVAIAGVVFLSIDISFFAANTLKIFDGGWLPLLLGLGVFTLLTTWRRGRELLRRGIGQEGDLSLTTFITGIKEQPPLRVPGTAVFLTTGHKGIPHALLHNLKHNKVLHERNVMLTIETLETPIAYFDERIEIVPLDADFYQLTLRFGFAEDPNVPQALERCARHDLTFDMMDTTFFVSRATVIAEAKLSGMALWRERLFAFMARNALPATAFLQIPGNRLVELGGQVGI